MAGTALEPGIVAVIQTFGDRINLHPHLHFLVTEGGLDEAGVFYKIPLRIVENALRRFPSKGWAEMIRKVYENDPMLCPRCGGKMKVISFLTDHVVVDRIIDHLKLTFAAERPPPPQVAFQECLWAADPPAEYFP